MRVVAFYSCPCLSCPVLRRVASTKVVYESGLIEWAGVS